MSVGMIIRNSCIAVALLGSLATIFFYAPEEASQGMAQKIFYVHLGLVASMYLSLFLGMLFAAVYLITKKSWPTTLSVACNEVGWLFTTGVLLTGSIWAKPIWGVWWTWDARLTTTLLIWLIYSSYLLVNYYFGETAKGKVASAMLAIIGFLDVPLIHYSVTLFRGVHPKVVGEGGLTRSMTMTLLVTVCSFIAMAAVLIQQRYHLGLLEEAERKLSAETIRGEHG